MAVAVSPYQDRLNYPPLKKDCVSVPKRSLLLVLQLVLVCRDVLVLIGHFVLVCRDVFELIGYFMLVCIRDFILVRHDITGYCRTAVDDRFFTGEKIAYIDAEGSAK